MFFRNFSRILISFILILSLIPFAYSVGVRGPGFKIMEDYQPGLKKVYTYQVITNSGFTQDYKIDVVGDLKDFITTEPTIFKALPDTPEGPTFQIILQMPDQLPANFTPGLYSSQVKVEETLTRGGGTVGSKTTVGIVIQMRVLCEGKCIRMNLITENININETENLKVNVQNWGLQKIDVAKSSISIFDSDNNYIGTVNTDSKSIESGKEVNLEAKWNSEGNLPGKYYANATLDYDGQFANDSDSFNIGSMFMNIINFTRIVKKGIVNEFKIESESRWNLQIENVYADVLITKEANKLTSFKTISDNFKPWQKKNLSGYLDAEKLETGEYLAEITLNYEGHKTYKNGTINVVESTDVETPKGFEINMTTILVAVLIVLILINLFWLFRRKKKDENKEQEQQKPDFLK
jgi:hypothetical protein